MLASPYGANPITLYSPSFGLNPKNAVSEEYNIPNEWGKFIDCIFSILFLLPLAKTVVSHSPTPSTDSMFASLNGDVKYE